MGIGRKKNWYLVLDIHHCSYIEVFVLYFFFHNVGIQSLRQIVIHDAKFVDLHEAIVLELVA